MPDSVITQTWLAYAFERPLAVERVRAALGRVGAHYGAQLAEPPPLRASLGDTDGLALWGHDDGSRWPAWAEGEGIAVAATAAPAGWRRVVGEVGAAEAALPLGRALAERPQLLAELVPPFVIGVREASAGPGAASGRLTIVNDFAGAGRIYERRLEPTDGTLGAEGWVWSNRLGALPIFAGAEPEPDERGWSLFAAAGWFIGDATPIRGTTEVAPGTAIHVRAGAGGAGAHIHHHVTRAAGELAGRHEAYFRGAVDEAANQAIGLARDLAELFAEPPTVDLSGGRDSRIPAAAAGAAGIDCRFATDDQEPGETEPDDDLRRRVRALHLVHDGMGDPEEIRGALPLPIPVEPTRPTLSGDGGEIARGFNYPSPGVLSEIRNGGEEDLPERLERRRAKSTPPPIVVPTAPTARRSSAPSTRVAATALPAPACSTTSTSSTGSPAAPASAPAAGATRPASPRPSSAPPSTSPPSSASRESSTTT